MAASNIRLPKFRHSIETATTPKTKQTIPDNKRSLRIVNKSFSMISVFDFTISFISVLGVLFKLLTTSRVWCRS